MASPLKKNNNYDERLLHYIIQYTKENKFPPTFQNILENVDGISSKSSLHNRLQHLMLDGLVVQKDDKGYYFPSCLNNTFFIGSWEINRIIELSRGTDNYTQIEKILMGVVNNNSVIYKSE